MSEAGDRGRTLNLALRKQLKMGLAKQVQGVNAGETDTPLSQSSEHDCCCKGKNQGLLAK